jgi:hypothetical protein
MGKSLSVILQRRSYGSMERMVTSENADEFGLLLSRALLFIGVLVEATRTRMVPESASAANSSP